MRVGFRIDKRLREALQGIPRDRRDAFFGRCLERATWVLENGGKRGTFRETADVRPEIGARWERAAFGNQKQAQIVLHEIVQKELGG